MNKKILIVVFSILNILVKQNAICQNTVSGQVTDVNVVAVSGARITLFDSALTYFQEDRTDAVGAYTFSNVPSGNYLLGVEKIGKEYVEQAIPIFANATANVMLNPETQPGIWNIIVQSPEALGGTNLGVLMPDGKIFYCHETVDPFYFDPTTNDTIPAISSLNVQGCVGPIQREDGKLWFIGGALVPTYGPGSKKVKYFNPSNNTWQFHPDMLDWRCCGCLCQFHVDAQREELHLGNR